MEVYKKIKGCFEDHHKIRYFLCYSLLFAISFVLVYITFVQRGVSFVQHPDGFQQYYPKMIYIDRYLKELFSNFLHGNFTFPQFDLNIGLGEDIYSIMGPWIMDLPFSLLSQFFGENQFEQFYAFNIISKLYLAGLSFSYVCLKWKKKESDVLVGAMCYVFSGYLIRIAPMHPAYISPFIFFPLIIYGLEKIMKGERPFLFIISLWSIMIRGYYFTYMISILVFIYGVTRYYFMYKDGKIKKFFAVFSKAVGCYLLAFLMSMVTLLPTIAAFFTSTRSGGTQFKGLLYSAERYKAFLKGFITPPGDYDYLAFVSVVILFLFLQFLKKGKESKVLKILIIECLVLFCFPLGGRLMNGLSYPSNRWSFAFIFLACYCVAGGLHQLLSLEKKQWIWISIGSAIYNVAFIWSLEYLGDRTLLPLMIFDLFVGCMAISYYFKNQRIRQYMRIVMTCLVLFNLYINGKYTFAEGYGNIAVEYSAKGTVDSLIAQTTNGFDFDSYDDGVYRVNSTNITNDNFSIVENVSTPSIYYSIINSAISDFLGEINCLRAASNFWISGVDNRVQIESLLGVKYYISTEQTKQYLPYGAEKVEDLGNEYSLYENPYAFPLIYSYKKYMLQEDFEKLNALEKQSIMLSAAIVEDEKDMERVSQQQEVQEAEFSVFDSKGIVWDNDGKLIVDSAENYLELEFDRKEGTELYVAFQNFDITTSGNDTIDIFVSYAAVSKTIAATSKDYTWHYDNENPWINMGVTGTQGDHIKIAFSASGEYSLEDIQIYQNNMEMLEDQTNTCGNDVSDVTFTTNKISCNVDLEKARIVNISVPYSKGWSMYVDGEEVEIFKVNNLSMGAEVQEGEHHIVLIYQTPFLKLSVILTIIGWIIFFLLYVVQKAYAKRK